MAEGIPAFDPDDFGSDSALIDNQWWPLAVGTEHVYEGYTVEDDEETPHRIVTSVTDLTKEIAGVQTRVVYERDYSEDELQEAELAFFAQDLDGNVWHLGQYYEVYEETEFIGGRVWLVSYTEGARAGIMMLAEPGLESPVYSQGYAPAPYYWTDRARVYRTGASVTTPVGDYTDVLVIEETDEGEAAEGFFQLKYYAKGVGNVSVGWRGNDAEQEVLDLVSNRRLENEDLASVRAEANALEQRAYVYGRTPPAE